MLAFANRISTLHVLLELFINFLFFLILSFLQFLGAQKHGLLTDPNYQVIISCLTDLLDLNYSMSVFRSSLVKNNNNSLNSLEIILSKHFLGGKTILNIADQYNKFDKKIQYFIIFLNCIH